LIQFILNEKNIATDLPAGMVILDFIRYHEYLMGTKIGCREGDCGACTILVGELSNDELQYETMTSCLMPLGNAQGKHIVSIEGINNAEGLNPIQQAMADEGATQCGFCTPGFVMSLAGFCLDNCHRRDKACLVSTMTTQNAIAAIDGNICRCTGYKPIERAAAKVADLVKEKNGEDPIAFASRKKILPEYFTGIKKRLQDLQTIKKSAALLPSITTLKENPYIVGGGTDLYVQKHDAMTNSSICFVSDHPELKGISREGNKCILGPSVTVSDLKASPIINDVFPEFQLYAKLVSSTPIRNMATIAGNFINASPIGDFTIFFLALDAQLVLSDGNTKREMPLRKLYTGYKTLDKKPEEYIEQIWFEWPDKDTLFHFEKVSKRTHLDIASVNSAIHIKMNTGLVETVSISAGGVGPVPVYLQKTSEFLKGKMATPEIVHEAIEVMKTEISPVSDARGTKEYKTLLLGQLIKAHFIKLFPAMITEKLLK
jgi:xanthine dehydrogenase small subunit